MERKNVFLTAAMAAALTIVSCSNDESDSLPQSPAELKISASMVPSLEVNTRAGYDLQSQSLEDFTKIGIYVWYIGETGAKASAPAYAGYANDKVASYSGSGTGPYTLTPTSTMYFPVNNADVDVYLYAPYNANPSQTDMCMDHTVSTDQSLTAGYVASDFIYGKATADYDDPSDPKEAKVTMYHAMSKIIFKVVNNGVDPNNMTDITLNNMFTKTTIRMPQAINNTAPYLTCGSNSTDNVASPNTLADIKVWGTPGTGAVTVADTQTNGVACVVPPQTTSTSPNKAQVTITVDGKTATADFSGKTLKPGYVYTYNLKLVGQTLTITLVSIKNWETDEVASDLTFDTWS